ncbi:MAG: ABC transporter ATP-binding protein [Rhodospirillaceae bacterium]|jgi:peptide/nickel transport system ATP-binding protein|nr:ABC transporter ATP-binding protein [Rhodospirillaceae bacterium]MBT5242795.1 ABC transporter ATP-binding protein [Rhodospirillaceae bacterium]MBT5563996.1 ABC transporter ATP-binding protein [Rhodospirillaceae bacterium]MBT6243271.1 ABC transporter ATP-binding protein [Rhodospirillaceae bacterium]
MAEKLLEIKDLVIEADVDDKWTPIVHGLSMSLERGEIIGFIGESGAGKSTFGLTALGYTKPGCRVVSGSIKLDGDELVGASEADLRNIRGNKVTYVAQSAAASFNPAHTLFEQFAESLVQHGKSNLTEARERCIDLFRQLDLPDPETILDRYPHQVSGGQLQRAMTAMALGSDPDLVIFDEPTTALDVTTQIEVLGAIKEAVKARNVAAIYITHDLAVVAQMADQIMVLRYGNIVEFGNAREMLANPKEEYTRKLLNVRAVRDALPDYDDQDLQLHIDNITATYPGLMFNILEDINITIKKGKTVAVVGESGSGKSTLARVITGLLPPSQGSVKFHGRALTPDLKSRPKKDLKSVQMIYQMADVAMNPRHKIKDIIGRPLEFYLGMKGKQRDEKVLELIRHIELPEDYAERYPAQLSGGEKQRVCIARALAAEPEIIICDEVTSALDQLVAEEILDLLLNLQQELGVSYLFITHDLATVKSIADEIVVMYQGSVVEQGPKADILSPPHASYTELLLSSVPEMDPDWLDDLRQSRKAAASETQ